MNKLGKYIILTALILLIGGCAVIASLEYTVGCKSELQKICDNSHRAKVIDKTTSVGCNGACMSLNYTLKIVLNQEICYYTTEYEKYDSEKYKIGSTYDIQLLGDGFCTLDVQPTSLEVLVVIFTIIGISFLVLLILFLSCCMIDCRSKITESDNNENSDSSDIYPL